MTLELNITDGTLIGLPQRFMQHIDEVCLKHMRAWVAQAKNERVSA